jgi:hypothetical protein
MKKTGAGIVLIVAAVIAVIALYLMFSGLRMRVQPKITPLQSRMLALPQGIVPVSFNAFHWQPVRKTRRIPSMHFRSSARGRPPPNRGVFTCGGSQGTIFARSSSETRYRFLFTCDLLPGPPCPWKAYRQINSYSDRL